MKKIKFIMPIFAAATIATSVAPLASCGQQAPKMTMMFEEDIDWEQSIYTYKTTPIYYYFKLDKQEALPKLQVKLNNLKIAGVVASEYKPGVTDSEIQSILSFKGIKSGKVAYIKLEFNLQKYWAIFGKSNDTAKFNLVFSNEENGYKFSQSFDNFVLPFRHEEGPDPEVEPTEEETITLKTLDQYTPEEKAKLKKVFDYNWDTSTDEHQEVKKGIRLLFSDYLRIDPGLVLEDNGFRKIVVTKATNSNEGYVKYFLGGYGSYGQFLADSSSAPSVLIESFPKGIKLVLDDADQPIGESSLSTDGGILFNVAFEGYESGKELGFEEIDLGKKFSTSNADPTPIVLKNLNGIAPFGNNTNLKTIRFSNRTTYTASNGESAHLMVSPFNGCTNINTIDVSAWKTNERVQQVINNEWLFSTDRTTGYATMFAEYALNEIGGTVVRQSKNFADSGKIIIAKGADDTMKESIKKLFLNNGGFEELDFGVGKWEFVEDAE